jgi:hypothetical protein
MPYFVRKFSTLNYIDIIKRIHNPKLNGYKHNDEISFRLKIAIDFLITNIKTTGNL